MFHLLTEVQGGKYEVSTVNLDETLGAAAGPEAAMLGALDPLFDMMQGLQTSKRFETMVFKMPEHKAMDATRYSTEEEAREGHEAMVLKWSTHNVAQA